MDLKSLGKSTNIDWQVSGRRYASLPSGPIPTLNIMLNLSVAEKAPLHLGHRTPCFAMAASNSAGSADSGMVIPGMSSIVLSALAVRPHFLHLVMGSAKLARCPDASKTAPDIIWEPSISIMASRLISSRRHSSRNLFFRATPDGPYSQNPACASPYTSQLGK